MNNLMCHEVCACPGRVTPLERCHRLQPRMANGWCKGASTSIYTFDLLSRPCAFSAGGLSRSAVPRHVTAAAGASANGGTSSSPSSQRPLARRGPPSETSHPSPPTEQLPPRQPAQSRPRPRLQLIARDGDDVVDRQLPEDNPSLDDIVLDEQYYKEMGISREEAQEILRQYDASELDPEGVNLGPDGLPTWSSGTAAARWARSWGGFGAEGLGQEEGNLLMGPELLQPEQEEDEEDAYGPEAVLLAGFRVEEHAMVRAVLDSAGGHVVKVLPVTETMLYGTVDEAVHSQEVDWAVPRAQDGPRGGAWGAQRTVLFSGLSFRAQLTLLELLESSGLHAVCAAAAREEHAGRRLGEVLAEAVATQRRQVSRMPKKELWQEVAAAAASTAANDGGESSGGGSVGGGRRFTDSRGTLPSLEDLIGEQAMQRARQIRPDVDEDEAEDEAAEEEEETDSGALAGAGPENGVGAARQASAGPAAGTAPAPATARPVAGPAPPPAGGPAVAPRSGRAAGMGDWVDESVLRPDGPALSAESLRAAEAAAADWETWRLQERLRRDAEDKEEDEDEEEGSGGVGGVGEGEDGGADWDPADLAKYGVDIGKLRDDVIQQLSEMDPEALEDYLLDSPYEDNQGAPLFEWREEEEEDGDGGAAGTEAQAQTAGLQGPTLEGLRQVAERQRRRWQEAQEQMEAAAAAEGRLVVAAESALATPPAPAPAAQPQPQQQSQQQQFDHATAVSAALPSPAGSSPTTTRKPYPPPADSLGSPASASATGAGATRQSARAQPAAAAPVATDLSSPSPSLDFDLGFGALDGLTELDDLLGQLKPAGAGTGTGGGGGAAATAAVSSAAPNRSGGGLGVPVPAAAPPTAAAVPGAAVSGGDPGGNSVLEQLRAAASGGAAPEALQKMLDEMYGNAPYPEAGTTPFPVELTASSGGDAAEFSERGVPVSNTYDFPEPRGPEPPRKRRGSLFAHLKKPSIPQAGPSGAGAQQQQLGQSASAEQPAGGSSPASRQRPKRSYGPAPPPEPDPVLKPLLDLRPEMAKALQDKKVKFMDLSKLNDKQKRQFVEHQARMKFEQQLKRHEENQRLQQQQWAEQGGLGGGSGQELHPGDGARPSATKGGDGPQEQAEEDEYQEQPGEGEEEDEGDQGDESKEGAVTVTAAKLRELMDASKAEGLSMEDTLAQAIAMGVRIPPNILEEVGLQAPSEEAQDRARADYERMFAEWAAEEGLNASNEGASADSQDDDEGPLSGSAEAALQEPQEGTRGAEAGAANSMPQPIRENASNSRTPSTASADSGSSIHGVAVPGSHQEVAGTAKESGGSARAGQAGKPRPWGAGLARPRRTPA